MMRTDTSLASTVMSGKPMKPADSTLAWSDSHLRGTVPLTTSVNIASAKFTPLKFNPVASAVPPFTPANALRFDPPRVRRFTVAVSPSVMVMGLVWVNATVVCDFSNASDPLAMKKPRTFPVNVPDAFNMAPLMSKVVVVAGPVVTVSGWVA